jgi:hypothetical protein
MNIYIAPDQDSQNEDDEFARILYEQLLREQTKEMILNGVANNTIATSSELDNQ